MTESETLTVSLIDVDSISASTSSKFVIKVPGKFRKKFKVNNYANSFNIDVGRVSLKGKVLVPEFGFDRKRTSKKFRVIAPFEDAVDVTLYEVDDDGSLGDVVDTTTADSAGEFELPEGATLGDEYMVVTEPIDGDEPMEAFVSQTEELVIDPVSTYVAEIMQEDLGEDPDAEFDATEIEEFIEQVEELNPTFQDTVSETIDAMELNYGAFTDNMIEIANDQDVFERTHSVNLQLGRALITKPNFAGVVDMFPQILVSAETPIRLDDLPENFSSGEGGDEDGPDDDNQGDSGNDGMGANNKLRDGDRRDNDNRGSCMSVDAEIRVGGRSGASDDVGFFTTIDDSNILQVILPAGESSEKKFSVDSVRKEETTALSFYPVGEGMYIGGNFSQSGIYSSADDALLEQGYNRGLISFVKKSEYELSLLDGTYGLVGYGNYVGKNNGRVGLDGFRGTFTSLAGEVSFDFTRSGLTADPGFSACCSYTITNQTEDETGEGGTFTIKDSKINLAFPDDDANDSGDPNQGNGDSSNLKRTRARSQSIFDGYARPDGNVIVFAEAEYERESSTTALDIAVKLPSSAPDLSSKSYQLIKLASQLGTTGGVTVSGYKDATISFAGTTVSITGITEDVVSRDSCTTELVQAATVATDLSAVSTIGENGSITFTIGTEVFNGYIAKDSTMIILQSVTNDTLTMYVATLKQ